mgnify:CR=1 FL=1
MIFGKLNDVFENENSILESIQQQDTDYKKPSFVSELLTKLSRYGMTYSEDVYKNMHALPANPDLIPKSFDQINNIYGSMIEKSDYRVKGEEDKPYNEKTLPQRLQVLRKMAGQPEIENILDIMANESIVYDSEQAYICQPYLDTAVVQMLSEENAEKIRNSVDTNFTKLYMLLDWKKNAWNIYKKYLIE